MILAVVPTQQELDSFLHACREQGYSNQPVAAGKLALTSFAELGLALAGGGLGKAQFAVQTQYLIGQQPWELVLCAGAAGALVDGLSVGDVVAGTETVEHDIRNRFGKPMAPRFTGSETAIKRCRQAFSSRPAFKLHVGPIASGDEDVVDVGRRAEIHEQTQALAVAWEGAGGARACHFSGVPFLEIRGITDSANGEAACDFRLNLRVAMNSVAQVVISLACVHLASVQDENNDQPRMHGWTRMNPVRR
jgi:adenosylhomocysteine nucleosidase